MFFSKCLTFLFFIYFAQVQGTEYIGCYKLPSKTSGPLCKLNSIDVADKFSSEVKTSVANAVEWLRQQQKNGTWFDIHTTSWIISNLIVSGYVNDNGRCIRTIGNGVKSIRQALKTPSQITDGQLAIVMIGMRATCQRIHRYRQFDLVKEMLNNLKAFPKGEFNNFYQYSLAIIALYVNDAQIPNACGKKLLRHILTNLNHGMSGGDSNMMDTEALSIIALAAVSRQKGASVELKKEIDGVIMRAEMSIDKVLVGEGMTNVVTLAHLLQVLLLKKNQLPSKPYCKKTFDWLLSQQDNLGAWGRNIMPTSTLLSTLSGNSILELKNLKCPIPTDDVDEAKIDKFIKSRRIIEEHALPTNEYEMKKMNADVSLVSEIEGVPLNAKVFASVSQGATAIDLLREASIKDSCFRARIKETSWGPMIVGICNVEQNVAKKLYWFFYVNGEFMQVGAGSYIVKENDHVQFRYKKWKN